MVPSMIRNWLHRSDEVAQRIRRGHQLETEQKKRQKKKKKSHQKKENAELEPLRHFGARAEVISFMTQFAIEFNIYKDKYWQSFKKFRKEEGEED